MNYQGHAFHPSFPSGRASGQLTLAHHQIRFDNDQANIQLPIEGAQFRLGGASNRLLFITHPTQPEWTIYTNDLQILNDPSLKNNPELQQQIRHIKQKRRWAWGLLAAVAILVVALPVILITSMNGLTAQVAEQVPVEWEQKLGEIAFSQYQSGAQFMPKEVTEQWLTPLTTPLITAVKRPRYPYQFHIINDSAINAFALPGGIVAINSGLILNADSAPELLGVIAHEIAHVQERHGIRKIMGTAGIYLTVSALLGDASGVMAILVDAAPFLINQSYSRSFETDADEKGLALLQRAAIDPQGLITFFETLRAQEKEQLEDTAGEDDDESTQRALAFLSTHPTTDDRINHLKLLISDLPSQQTRDLHTEFAALQNQVKHFVAQNEGETKR